MNSISKRNILLKIASILIIIFSAIWIVGCLAGIAGLTLLSDKSDVMIVDLGLRFGTMFLIRMLVTKAFGLIVGICGLTLRKKKPLLILGIIYAILTAISCVTKSFVPVIWVLMVLPGLYLAGVAKIKAVEQKPKEQ